MVTVRRIVLDVLKPHHPNGLEFVQSIAEACGECRIRLTVSEMDEKTETVVIVIEGGDIQYDRVVEVIANLGGSVHSVDEVDVVGSESAR